MILSALLSLVACSTPEAPKPAPAPPIAAPAPMPAGMPMSPDMKMEPGATMPAGMPMAAPAGEEKAEADAGPATVIPDTYAGIVTEMQAREAKIKDLLAAGQLKDVHAQAKVIMDLAVAAPSKAPAASQAKVSLKALDLKKEADELHDHADDGDAAGARTAFDAVSADIAVLASVPG